MNESEANSTLTLLTAVTDGAGQQLSCTSWPAVHRKLFQMANLFYLAAFLIPHTFRLGAVAMRVLVCGGLSLLAAWAGGDICAPDALAWSLTLIAVNVAHLGHAGWLERPTRVPLHLKELHRKLFVPLRVDNREFRLLTRPAEWHALAAAEVYAVENGTPTIDRLSVLLTGKLEVVCEGIHLHYVVPNQFVDSPEWESERVVRDAAAGGAGRVSSVSPRCDQDDMYQVSIIAVEDSTYLTWSSAALNTIMKTSSFLNAVIRNLVGKDVSQKLYRVAERLGSRQWNDGGCRSSGPFSPLALRSYSVDRVHTGTKGLVRSQVWLGSGRRGSHLPGFEGPVGSPHRVRELRAAHGRPAAAVGYRSISLTPEMAVRTHRLVRPTVNSSRAPRREVSRHVGDVHVIIK